MIEIEPFMDLVFVYQSGCEACETAMPELDKFASSHPQMMIVKVQADGPIVERLLGKFRIRATPTYVIRRNGHGVFREGAMTSKQIGDWIKRVVESED